MAEALDPDLMHPKTEAEAKLVQQLQEGRARQQERAGGPGTTGAAAPMETDAAGTTAAAAAESRQQGGAGTSSPAAAAGDHQTRWGRCFYTRLPRRVTAPGAQGAELTALNLDKTAALERAAAGAGDAGGKALLGELQFAYVAFLCGQSLEGALVCWRVGNPGWGRCSHAHSTGMLSTMHRILQTPHPLDRLPAVEGPGGFVPQL
jgi:A1 cistron-splicing factor AAR2